MPAPTVDDFFALEHLSLDITELRKTVRERRRDSSRKNVVDGDLAFQWAPRVFGGYDAMSAPDLVLLLLLDRRFWRSRDNQAESPVFDELWELRGGAATGKDMAQLMAGGSTADAFRAEVARSKVGAQTVAQNEKRQYARFESVSARLENLEVLLRKIAYQNEEKLAATPVATPAPSDVTSEVTDVER